MAKRQSDPKKKKVTFSFKAPNASSAYVAGDFNGWFKEKHPMKKGKTGVWEKTVMLPPGKYEYRFVIDEAWYNDPSNNLVQPNCYGTSNNIIDVSVKK